MGENAGYRTPPSKGHSRQERINLLEMSPVAGKNLMFSSPENTQPRKLRNDSIGDQQTCKNGGYKVTMIGSAAKLGLRGLNKQG